VGANAEVIVDGVPDQLPTNIRTVADLLGSQGWASAAFGKWDVGMTTWGCTPTCRGFNHFSGFYNAYNDYFTHEVGPGVDLRQDFAPDEGEKGTYFTELLTARVAAWIKGVRLVGGLYVGGGQGLGGRQRVVGGSACSAIVV
jgi:arylsulfatase A-like enzyme